MCKGQLQRIGICIVQGGLAVMGADVVNTTVRNVGVSIGVKGQVSPAGAPVLLCLSDAVCGRPSCGCLGAGPRTIFTSFWPSRHDAGPITVGGGTQKRDDREVLPTCGGGRRPRTYSHESGYSSCLLSLSKY